MICPACGSTTEASPPAVCDRCRSSLLLDERYALQEILGRRGGGTTYRARDVDASHEVVVKELMLRRTESMKEVELFEREAELLQSLEHPGVPRFERHFELVVGKQVGLYLVQEYVAGESLEHRLGQKRFTEREVAEVLAGLLDVLAHLSARGVVHRDLKPANVIRDRHGGLHLVDFGAGRAVAESMHRSGSTIAGTFGYMAPEQLRGRATPASDLYALGALAVRLLTRLEPATVLADGRRGRWRDHADVTPGLAGLIDALLSEDPADRPDRLERLAEELAEFARGEAVLEKYVTDAVVASPSGGGLAHPRPTVRDGAVEVYRRTRGSLVLTVLFAAAAAGIVAVFGVASVLDVANDIFAVCLMMVLGGLLSAASAVLDALSVLSNWRLARAGTATRAIVSNVWIESRDCWVECEFTHVGERERAAILVAVNQFATLEPGEEVLIAVDPKDSERIALLE